VHRLAPKGLDEVTYPELRSPAFVDWVDYKARLARNDPATFARRVLARAGTHTLWYVSSPGYTTHPTVCADVSNLLAASRTLRVRIGPDARIFEHPGLQEFPTRSATRG
jgi:hypothetical protein